MLKNDYLWKNGSLVSRRKALAFLMNNTDAVKKYLKN